MWMKDMLNMETFGSDIIDGYAPLVQCGKLGLVEAKDRGVVLEKAF